MWRAVLLGVSRSPAEGPRRVEGTELLDSSRPWAVAQALEDADEPVLLLSHGRHAPQAATAATLLQGHRPDLLVAHACADAAPLALLGALAVARERASDAAHAVALWRAVVDATWSGAALSSVAALSAPNPSVLQHVRSWWPGSRFLVRLHPDAAAVDAARAAELLAGVERGATDALVSGAADEPVLRALLQQVSPRTTRTVELPDLWDDVLGGSARGQVALVPADLDALLPPPGPPCRTCGLAGPDAVCPFCRTSARAEPSGADPVGAQQ